MTQPKTPRIFRHFSSTDFKNTVVHYANLDLDAVEFGYATAAKRLGESMKRHDSYDDLVLIPYMFLWRHAIELTLKNQLRFAIHLRSLIDLADATNDYDNVRKLLEKKHNLSELFTRLKEQFQKLNLPWFEQKHVQAFHLLADSDTTGQYFRYAGNADNDQSHIDFVKLSNTLNELYEHLSSGMDVLNEYRELLSEAREAEALFLNAELEAFEAQMEADFEADLREYLGESNNDQPL